MKYNYVVQKKEKNCKMNALDDSTKA